MRLCTDLQGSILQYVHPQDKIYASVVCKLWRKLLEENFIRMCKTSDIIVINGSYDLSIAYDYLDDNKIIFKKGYDLMYFSYHKNGNCITCPIINYDINTLNFIIKIEPDLDYSINQKVMLTNYCKLNCTLTEYVKEAFQCGYGCSEAETINILSKYKKFDLLKYHIVLEGHTSNWYEGIIWNKIVTNKQFNNIVKTLKFLIEQEVVFLPRLYRMIHESDNCVYKDKFMKFVEPYLDEDEKVAIRNYKTYEY